MWEDVVAWHPLVQAPPSLPVCWIHACCAGSRLLPLLRRVRRDGSHAGLDRVATSTGARMA